MVRSEINLQSFQRSTPHTLRKSVHPRPLDYLAQLIIQLSLTLEEIEDAHEFIWKLEKIEPPNQLVAVIDDPLLQKYLQLRSSNTDWKRIESWLLMFFEDQLGDSSGEGKIFEMLAAILRYTQYTKV